MALGIKTGGRKTAYIQEIIDALNEAMVSRG